MRVPQALVCGYHVPQPDLDSSSRRLFHFVRFFQEAGWGVVAAAKNSAAIDSRARRLRQQGIPVYPLGAPELDELVGAGQFDVAVLAFWHVAERLVNLMRTSAPMTRILVDSMDLHFLRQARRVFTAAREEGGGNQLLDAGYALQMAREVNVYAAADGVLAVSRKEAELVDDLVGQPGLSRFVPDCEDLALSPYAFDDRKGIVFIGNFEHPPNVDAVRFLCDRVLPLIDPSLLATHPVLVVGNDLETGLEGYSPAVDHVRLVGWVPSVQPYLERSRISVLPLRFGAGTKRKLIQALMVGTPSVCTTIGAEGFDIEHGEHALLADSPQDFAAAITRALTDRELWERVRDRGQELALATRGLAVGRQLLFEAVDEVMSQPPKALRLGGPGVGLPSQTGSTQDYEALVRRVRALLSRAIPAGSTFLAVSRGDPDLVRVDGRDGWHFPQIEGGVYAGSHPADSASAIAHLEEMRRAGAEFIVIPSTARWWLDHYREFGKHLTRRYRVMVDDDDTCLVIDLRRPGEPEGGADGADHSRARAAAPESREHKRNESADRPGLVAPGRGRAPVVSVVIPTRNRAALLAASLESLAAQSLPADQFEVIVVDDGSQDETAAVCEDWQGMLALRCLRADGSGIAVAKNKGLTAAAAPLVFFFDDDDVAHPDLISEHIAAHRRHPRPELSVLGYTTWASTLPVAEVMRFVTDVGHYLFAYDGIREGQRLDFTYFWGGRSSCKRSFLLEHGVFRPEFTFGCEDIELGFRLSKVGLRVVYHPRAVQYMNRTLTYDDFCARCERQGRSQWLFSRMHREAVVQRWCQVDGAEERWQEREPLLDAKRARVYELERAVHSASGDAGDALRRELHGLYWWTFEALKAKGIVESMHEETETAPANGRGSGRSKKEPSGRTTDAGAPDFIGIGGQKCATTFVFEMLKQHPEVGFPATRDRFDPPAIQLESGPVKTWPKEIQFLAGPNSNLSWSTYLDLFRGNPSHKVYGEISPAYLAAPKSRIEELRSYAPAVRLFVILRDPVERDWSAIRMIAKRRGELEDVGCLLDIASWPQVREMGDYVGGLENWLGVFPREQLLLLPYELIRADCPRFLRELCEYLGVSADPLLALPRPVVFEGPPAPLPSEVETYLRERHAGTIERLERLCEIGLRGYWTTASTVVPETHTARP